MIKSKHSFKKLAITWAVIMAAVVGRAQIAATLTDIGPTITPGANDISQILIAAAAQNPPGLNYYWDNGTPNGSTFTTGNNAGGYILNSVAIQTLGNGGNNGSPNSGPTTYQNFNLRIYAISGPGVTGVTANLVAYFQGAGALNAGGDWFQMSGLNLPVSPNTIYAYTFSRSTSSYINLGNTNGNPYAGGMVCQIPAAGGGVTFSSNTNFDATFDVSLSLPTSLTVAPPTSSQANPITKGTTVTLTAGTVVGNNGSYTYQWQTDGGGGSTLTNIPGATSSTLSVNTTLINDGAYKYQVVVVDSAANTATSASLTVNVIQVLSGSFTATGTTAPSAGSSDAAQLVAAGSQNAGGLNYYSDNNPNPGQTFTTGSNAKGYSMNSVAIDFGGGASGNSFATPQRYDLYVFQISQDGTTATLLADVTNLTGVFSNYPTWIQWNFPAITLNANTVYAYTFHRVSTGYAGLATSAGSDVYPGGQIALIPNTGGTITYSTTPGLDGVFDVGLIPNGVPFNLTAVSVNPNPSYALSPVSLSCKPTTPGIFTYRWLTDDGSGSTPPNYQTVAGATATNLTVIPKDVNPGGDDYTTNFYFVATDTTSGNSVTSSVAILTVHAASAPQMTGPTPTNLVTFVGNNILYSVGELGTLPITNQWLFNNGGGFGGLTGRTNTILLLTNVQTGASGTYEIAATNLIGSSNVMVTLSVLPDPASPLPASQKYFNQVFTNQPWAYWRLNETNDPTAVGAPTYRAYDYSGHNFDPTYGSAVTVSNAGPQSPTFPGFDTNELAAGTAFGVNNSALTVPSLNMAGNSNVTFMAWINPAGQLPSAGLFFNRGGPDNACGFGFGGTADHLGYTWNNNSQATWSWDSTLVVANGQWNFVAYVITPTNATIYLGNLSGGTTNFQLAVNPIPHIAETFAGGTILLGGDPFGTSRYFNGLISEASLFTNALTTAQIQQYFLTAIGASALAPSVTPIAALPSTSVYSGQNVRLTAPATGTAPLTNQWQVSNDNATWVNVAGATADSLVINPQIVGTFYYQMISKNAAGSGSSGSIGVTFNPLPSYPAGQWTVNFQETNNIMAGQTTGAGIGRYVGRGILGGGTYWNVLPHILAPGGEYGANTINSVSDYLDDGVTHSGIYCRMNSGGSYNSYGSSLPYTSDIRNLTEQFYRTYFSDAANGNGALQFFGVPAGTYNLVCFAGNGKVSNGANNYGSTFVVIDALNGNQTNRTANPAPGIVPLTEGANFITFTNVHIAGTLNVDVQGNDSVGGSAIISGAQLQLVHYDAPAPAVTLNSTFNLTNKTLALNWNQGILQTTTNLLAPWTSIYVPSPITVTITNGSQFYRVKIQ